MYFVFTVRKKLKYRFENTVCSNIDLVVDGYVDAVTLQDPPPRYLIGRSANNVKFLAMLPTAIQDRFLLRRSTSKVVRLHES